MELRSNERAWADYLITRAGLFLFCSLLLISAFKIHPLFIPRDEAGRLDAQLLQLTSFIEGVETSGVQGTRYFTFDDPGVSIYLSVRYVSGDTEGSNTRAMGLMGPVYPANSLWTNRSDLLGTIAARCSGRTGLGDNVLQGSDWQRVEQILREEEVQLAQDPFMPDPAQPLLVEKVILNYLGPAGVEKRGITIVYQ